MSGGETGKGGRKLVPEISTNFPTVDDEVRLTGQDRDENWCVTLSL
jgi:hypothetical protein